MSFKNSYNRKRKSSVVSSSASASSYCPPSSRSPLSPSSLCSFNVTFSDYLRTGELHGVMYALLESAQLPPETAIIITAFCSDTGRFAVIQCSGNKQVVCGYERFRGRKSEELRLASRTFSTLPSFPSSSDPASESPLPACPSANSSCLEFRTQLTHAQGVALAKYFDLVNNVRNNLVGLNLFQKMVWKASEEDGRAAWQVAFTSLEGADGWELAWLNEVCAQGGRFFQALLMVTDHLATLHPGSTTLHRVATLLMCRRLMAVANNETLPVLVGFPYTETKTHIHILRVVEYLLLLFLFSVGVCLFVPIPGWEYGWGKENGKQVFGWEKGATVWSWEKGSFLSYYVGLSSFATVVVSLIELMFALFVHFFCFPKVFVWMTLYHLRSLTLCVLPAMSVGIVLVQFMGPTPLGWLYLLAHAVLIPVGRILYVKATVPDCVAALPRMAEVESKAVTSEAGLPYVFPRARYVYSSMPFPTCFNAFFDLYSPIILLVNLFSLLVLASFLTVVAMVTLKQ